MDTIAMLVTLLATFKISSPLPSWSEVPGLALDRAICKHSNLVWLVLNMGYPGVACSTGSRVGGSVAIFQPPFSPLPASRSAFSLLPE